MDADVLVWEVHIGEAFGLELALPCFHAHLDTIGRARAPQPSVNFRSAPNDEA